ncbi:MAG TPA: hypothetical protein VLS48_08800, partial [Anaerolineales bacterium]|nr:hypothetical protein [Anaerolineales bacterium]
SSVVYFQLGRNAQYHSLLNQAESAAQQADAAADLSTQRLQYQAALQYLQQAVKIGDTPEASNLLLRVQQSLDQIDNIRRAEYRRALLEPLPDDVVISRLLIEDSFLYMLDQTSGAVLRAVSTGDGYLLDRTFQCGPQFPGGFGAGPLVDITLVAEGDPDVVLLGIDAGGRVMRCYLSKPPEVETLAVPAQMQSSGLRGITEADGVFYVLDPPNSEVWFYWNGNFGDVQQFFVGVAPPAEMATMVDLAVERFNLYLLNQSGAVTLCSLSTLDVAPTRCSENLGFTDGRSGAEGMPISFEQPFTQVMVSPPPDPSLFLLQAETQGIFQFSLNNLVYQRQYMPFLPLGEGGATAFYVDRLHQQLYLAVGGEVYFTTMP